MKAKVLVSSLFSMFIIALVHTFLYPTLYNNGFSNIIYYCIISIIYMSAFILLYYFITKKDFNIEKYVGSFVIAYLIFFILWFISMYFTEETLYYYDKSNPRHNMPVILYFLLLAVATFIIYFCISSDGISKLSRIVRIVVSFALAFLQGLALAAPNFLQDKGGTLFHIHSYFNPIYNAVDMRPLDDIIRSIYGHYPIFYIIPTRIFMLFGISKFNSVMLVTCLIGFLAFFILYIAMGKMISKNSLFFISIFTISYISFFMHRGGQYYQVLPHRILFPAIVMLYISIYKYKTPSKLILVLISVLAVTWNIESAVACMACMLCFVFCRSKKTFRDILMCIGIFIGSFVGAYGIVNFANISMGGKLLSFMDFIYPIMDNGYKINALAVKIPGVYGFFFFAFGLFMLLLLSGLIALFKNKLNPDIIVLMSVSLLGLGMMPYYINRAAVSNLVIVHIPLAVEISLIANVLCSGSENKSFTFKKYNKYILILLSFIFSFYDIGNVYGIPETFKMRLSTSWEMKSFNEFMDNFSYIIPKDTPVMGAGLPDIYASLNWDPKVYLLDWGDWQTNKAAVEYVKSYLASTESVVIMDEINDYINPDDWIYINKVSDRFTYLIKRNSGLTKEEDLLLITEEMGLPSDAFVNFIYLNYNNSYPDEAILEKYVSMLEGNTVTREEMIEIINQK